MSDGNAKTGTIVTARPHEQFAQYLIRRAEEGSGDRGKEVARNQIDRILTADTPEDIWDADEGGTIAGQDFTGVEFRIHGFDVAESDKTEYDEGALGVYALIRGTLLQEWNGEPIGAEILVNCGAPLVVTKLRQLEVHGLLPADVFIKGTPARKGEVLKLRPVPKRATAGTTVA